MRHALIFMSLVLTMGGCAAYYGEYWSRSGGTEAQFQAAALKCESDAATRYPPMTLGRKGWFATPDTWCTQTAGGPNCVLINPGYLPQAQSAADTNELPRSNAFRACMMAGGWRPVGPGSPWLASSGPGIPEAAIDNALKYCKSIYRPKVASDRTAAFNASFDQCVMTRARELSGPRPPA